jgi:hypothetical protein
MPVGFTTTCAISVHHHQSREFEPRSWRGVLETRICDKVCYRLATGRWFSPDTLVSSINKTDYHEIAEILLKVALNTKNKSKPRAKHQCTGCILSYISDIRSIYV